MTPLPLRLFAYLRHDDGPLTGDLLEQYGRGRSTLWLWRQVAAALATGAWSDLQRHPLDGARAVIALALFAPAVVALFSVVPHPLEWRPSGPVAVMRLDWLFMLGLRSVGAAVLCGWMAGHLAGRFRRVVLVSLAIAGLIPVAQSAWFVGGVLWLYPWNGFFAFAQWASIYLLLASPFLVGLYLGASLSAGPSANQDFEKL